MKINTVVLENNQLKVEILPELGGRISSILYKPENKNWVWNNANNSVSKVRDGKNYDDNWQGGWEELFPNDEVETFSWGTGYDHGELWFNTWDVQNFNKNKVSLEINNLESGTKFVKTFSIKNSTIYTKYSADISFEDHFLFKLHLAIPLEEKLYISVEHSNLEKVEKNFGNILETSKTSYFLEPQKDTGLFDFAYLNNAGNYIKIIDSKKNVMELTFDNTTLEYFWIFQSQGGWRNHNVVVLEPCSNGKKIISEAVNHNQAKKGPSLFSTSYQVKFSNL
jgi:hypothetical protein